MADPQDTGAEASADRVVIKKYANRRLYNTASSSYVTLEHLAEMVKKNVDFVVYDAKSGDDITRTVLTQIIFEEESQGHSLLPVQFLRQLIGFYGDSLQSFLPSYLEMSLASFAQQQERLRTQFAGLGAGAGVGAFDVQIRQNLQLFDRAMRMFSPFAFAQNAAAAAAAAAGTGATAPTSAPAAPADGSPAAAATASSDAELAELRNRMAEMQAQIEKLAKR